MLSGGVFQNQLLLARTPRAAPGRVLVPQRLPANDGGIAYGQAAIAAASDLGPAPDGARALAARNVRRAMAAADSTAFRALSDVVLAIAAEHEVEPVLQQLVHSARELGGARYAALGIPDGEGAFESFITSGMSDELIEAMGPLPRTHGMLGAMLDSAEPHLHRRHHRRPALPRLVAERAPA